MRILILVALALISTTTIALAHGEPELIVTPERVDAGGSIHVKGTMVSENGTIVVTLESAKFRIALGAARGDADGNFEAEFVIPTQVPEGEYELRALGNDGREGSAKLTVLAAGASTASGAAKPSEINLSLRDGMLTAMLRDADGKPLADQTIAFTQRTIFGTLTLGIVKTDAAGLARLPLENAPDRETEIAAVFAGSARFAQSLAALKLNAGMPGEYAPLDLSLITPTPPPLLAGVILGLASIAWGLYAVVVYQLFRIVRPKRAAQSRSG
jgi:hypothetical protein